LDRFFPAAEDPGPPGVEMELLHNNPGEGHLPDPDGVRDAVDRAERRCT
jgi:hypothetical protein